MNQEHTSEAYDGDPVHHRLTVTTADVTLSAGGRVVARAPRTVSDFSLVETARAVTRLHERSRESLDRERIGEAIQLTQRMGRLLGERAGSPVCRALSDAARDALRSGDTLPLALEAESPSLAGLPWEMLLLPGEADPLALHPVIRPFRTGPGGGHPTQVAAPGTARPLRLVALLAGPSSAHTPHEGLLDLEAETARLTAAVTGSATVDLRLLSSGSLDALAAALREAPADIVHIVCHARPGHLRLETVDGTPHPVTADDLYRALTAARSSPVLVLAGCSTASARRLPGQESGGTAFLPGMAEQLAASGMPAVLAMSAPVRDAYAGRLTAAFHAGLASGVGPLHALHSARLALETARRTVGGDAALPEWHIPVLYTTARTAATPSSGSPSAPGPRTADPGAVPDERHIRTGPTATPLARPPLAQPPLALPLGTFVGRRPQLRIAARALGTEGTGLVVHGVGGGGKSAFVGELLRFHGAGRPVALVRGRTDVEEVLHTITAVLPGPVDETHPLTDARRPWPDRLREFARTAADVPASAPVLVLDEFEANLARRPGRPTGFTDPELGALLESWAALDPRPPVLVTSRHPLPPGRPGAARLPHLALPPLTPAETDLLRLRLPQTRRLPSGEWDRFKEAVGGHPRTYGYLDALLSRTSVTDTDLARRLEELTDGIAATRGRIAGRTRGALREALRITAADTLLDDLVATLDAESRSLLTYAAVHRSPVPQQAFTDAEDVAGALDELVSAGLLAPDSIGPDGEPLWSVHRWTAAELAALDAPSTHRGHERAAAHWADVLDRQTLPQRQRVHAGFEAVDHHEAVGRPARAAEVAQRLCRLLHGMGRWTAEENLCRRVLDWVEPGSGQAAQAHRQLGLIARDRGTMHPAREHLERALTVSDAAGDLQGIAFAEHQLGSVLHELGDYADAERRYRRAFEVFQRLGLDRDAAASRYQLAMLEEYRGSAGQARTGYEEALAAFERAGDTGAVVACLRSLAYVAQDAQDMTTAMAHCRTAAGLCRDIGDEMQEMEIHNQVGSLHVIAGELDEAHAEFDTALRIATARDATEEIARSHQHLGICAERQGSLDIAEEHVRIALDLNRELRRVVGQAQCLTLLASLARGRGRPLAGLAHAREALALYRRTDETRERPATYRVIGDCFQDLGRPAAARRYHSRGPQEPA
ncbi:tetratricopeptide repeat protein [Streptomyces brasiliscabiei]|uniref:tetratricopeptide repeat protein n=1 Tax=Streptomyces brasiliscabiei TaxID=2736302 RepID=UPI001C127E0B|nr:tetratricopeptide repeat protein [Streptomyces brasiliscabiei]